MRPWEARRNSCTPTAMRLQPVPDNSSLRSMCRSSASKNSTTCCLGAFVETEVADRGTSALGTATASSRLKLYCNGVCPRGAQVRQRCAASYARRVGRKTIVRNLFLGFFLAAGHVRRRLADAFLVGSRASRPVADSSPADQDLPPMVGARRTLHSRVTLPARPQGSGIAKSSSGRRATTAPVASTARRTRLRPARPGCRSVRLAAWPAVPR